MLDPSDKSTIGIDLGNWHCHVVQDKGITNRDIDFGLLRFNVKTYACQIKRLLGRKFSDPELQLELDYVPFRVIEGPNGYPLVHVRYKGEDRAFTPTEILAMLIHQINTKSQSSYCIGIPIYFTDQQKMDVIQAGVAAGMPPSSIFIDEATAMVLGYYKFKFQRIVAFIDIGHASMQVLFTEYKPESPINILYEAYASSLGGREFDKILFKYFASKIREEHNIDVYTSSIACLHLWEACESLKMELSTNNEASYLIKNLLHSTDVMLSISREDFEKLSTSLLKKIEVALQKALNESGLNAQKVDYIEAVGKGCCIPEISNILTKVFGERKGKTTCYFEHVARGCATQSSFDITRTHKIKNNLTAGMSTIELVSSDTQEEDSSDKLLWKRAMDKDGHLLPFLNDFLKKNIHHIGKSKKTEEESYWLSKAGSSKSFWKALLRITESPQNKDGSNMGHTAEDTRVQNDEVEKLIEQLKLERDNARKEVEELRRLNMEIPRSQYVEFSYSDLQDATNNFQESLKLGEGGFGIVYKGIIHETTVAIKMLKDGSSQGAQEFNQEVAALSMVRHPNLVTMIGACSETRALIYEYLPQGSLEDHLRCKNNTSPLSWQARVRIAFEICTALSFLHHCKPHGLVHGDLKPDNILVDSNNISKISDFGLCRQLNWTDSASIAYHWTDCPKGTLAYMDPEYLSTGKITPQYDVYSFGIMLLRLVTCKEPRGLRLLVEEAKKKGTLKTLVDASAGPWPFKEANKMISLGLRCSDLVRKNRPDLSTKVLKEMKSMLDIASASASS